MGNFSTRVNNTTNGAPIKATVQTSFESDFDEGNMLVDKSRPIAKEIQKALPADDGPWKLFTLSPLPRRPFWKHVPLSEEDTVDSVNTDRLIIRAVRHGQCFFFPCWKQSYIHKPKVMDMIPGKKAAEQRIPGTKPRKQQTPKVKAHEQQQQLALLQPHCAGNRTLPSHVPKSDLVGNFGDNLSLEKTGQDSTPWVCHLCDTSNPTGLRCGLCGEPTIGSEEAQRWAQRRQQIRDETKARMEEERRRVKPVPIDLCGHSMVLASDRTAPMHCPANTHADTERPMMVRFIVVPDRARFIVCCVCRELLVDDFAWRCGEGAASGGGGDTVSGGRCDFVCCDDCKKTRASRWTCMQCGMYRGRRDGTVRVTSEKLTRSGICVWSAPKYPGVKTAGKVHNNCAKRFSRVRLVPGPRSEVFAGVFYLYLYEIGPGQWLHDFNPDDPNTRSLTVVEEPNSGTRYVCMHCPSKLCTDCYEELLFKRRITNRDHMCSNVILMP